ncbi:unnamed protein product [Linum tenue]|uniref:Lipoxygenase n=1 Tax=Linum tenue TaxID=586396 RepID=A0AAV0JQS2_9ROSI|nr:unnamed protein product [Linum tenue]
MISLILWVLLPAALTLLFRNFRSLFLKRKTTLENNNNSATIMLTASPPSPPSFSVATPGRMSATAATMVAEKKAAVKVKAVVTVKETTGGFLGIGMDDISDFIGKALKLHLVSAQLHLETGLEKPLIKTRTKKVSEKNGEVKYATELEVPGDFGEVGAVIVENEHYNELFLIDIVLDGLENGPVKVICDSWVHPRSKDSKNRVFFTAKSYLPSETPNGLTRYRAEELSLLRGNGEGERQQGDRIYDYDVYNDLGKPDSNPDLARPVLGGKEHPYPRRVRTGRPRSETDPLSETGSSNFYVPRDEEFSQLKQSGFSATTTAAVLRAVVPAAETIFIDRNLGFPHLTAVDSMYDQGINLPPRTTDSPWTDIIPRLVRTVVDSADDILQFVVPDSMKRDRFFWLKDEQFGRQTLAGVNPCSIELVKEWPLKSKLDPEIYGPAESAITTKIVEQQIRGFMTLAEAMDRKKLFMLDYHDLLLPFVGLVRQQEGTTLYGSRALFFLTPVGTLKPVAIELVRPPSKEDGKPQWKRVFTPANCSATEEWLWKLAKAHVLAHDSGYHELVSHFLRTHACLEPYIIATNRQLSAMHPIHRLLHPHFRYTMEINSLARQALISAGGIIELAFSPLKYAMQLGSAVYDQRWRFDYEALPKDLIRRGMAVEDPSAPHGLKLTIEDYPYASDGLILWDGLHQWVSDYVNHYYPDPSLVSSDVELQSWWTEIRTVGHGDKKDEPWWPSLATPSDLIEIVTTIAWTASAQHAAVNFGQYAYGGYFPNRPSIARTNMPTEDPTDEAWKQFIDTPEKVLLEMFPSQFQAAVVMAILDVLSNHSVDEEYIGQVMEPAWGHDAVIRAAFERFHGRMKALEVVIDARNANEKLRNRNGAGVLPYELLKPFSEPGVTGKGVPYSTSI